jgi:hypothetical protein
MNLQDSKASDAKTLQSPNSQNAKIRILLNALRVVHGRLRRGKKGRFKESDDVGRSLRGDRRKKAKRKVRSGYGDRGDR